MPRPLVMGVLNVTPDSFFDGGSYVSCDAAISRAREMVAEGADIVDVGGESTRPGAHPVDEEEEARRVLPVIEAIAGEVRVSVDTRHATVARLALKAGATMLNDVSASLAAVAAQADAAFVAMHMRGTPADMQDDPRYDDVVGEVFAFLAARADEARALGLKEIYVDPGIGFAKTVEHNLELLRALPGLVGQGTAVAVGTSRKSFLGKVLAAPGEPPLPPEERAEGSLATAVWAMACGAAIVRVHDVEATAQAARLLEPPADAGRAAIGVDGR